ncbi:family 20 glycosylhydrolase [Lysobacter sp. F60174L2]|uniref:family 20 glycosylhydrolase n=1 Tax=Lysobacter sp. F60174L2 TaxID=3459295 RepID=UPI00403D93A3
MKLRHLLLLALLPLATFTAHADARADAPMSLIPAPASLTPGEGTFELRADTPLVATDPRAVRVARQFAGYLQRGRHVAPRFDGAGADGAPAVEFRIAPMEAGASPEAYSLDVSPRRIVVSAGDERGLFYGAVTLWQLATSGLDEGTPARIPALHIDDTPRFAWRGLMLDSARHFQSVDEIKQLLDAMARHKLNTFHWHLTDDQGWRLPIPGYPELTATGACRIPAGGGGIDPDTGKPAPYCGFYTREQVRGIVRYADERHITVVPEIDIPGHAQAAVASYPRLGSVDGPTPVSNEWGVHKYLFNADEDTFAFLEDVMAEVVELFPGRYVHIGGDEAVKDQWKASPRVQARMRELGVADEAQLQGYFVERMARFLAAHGKRVIGWDEILEDDLPADATVMSWRGIEGGIEAAGKGHDVVMTPVSHLYFDYQQTGSPDEPPGRPKLIPLRKTYGFEPVPDALTPAQARHILGLQANVWTEHMRSFERVEHAFFPRIAAVAETGWTPRANKDYADFLARLPAQLDRYRSMGIDYARTPFDVRIEGSADGDGAIHVALSQPVGLGTIRYTVDGTPPTQDSPSWDDAPLSLRLPVEVQAAAFVDGRVLGAPASRRFDAASLLRREDEELAMCSQGLMLRLEDDGPFDGPRAIYNVDIFNPCWLWSDAPLDGIGAVDVVAGRIPYYFQLAGDEPNRRFQPARSAHGELELRDGCEGGLLASVPLPAEPDANGFVTLRAPLPARHPASADLCIVFTGDTRPTMWVVDRVALRPDRH